MLRDICAGAILVVLLLLAQWLNARAEEYTPPQQRWVVLATVCNAQEQCRRERLPVEADNSVHCMMGAGWMRVTQWLTERPSLHLKSVNGCRPADEHDL
ncbi:hypothetical protein GJ654_18910 [Rhodoblastus acidophilus]|uniref:Uncharacterized protein n=1 Tax=Rhodoblastus acidophilus TaxID=1074 RepID=A0A6N8DU03_RHOAC|nr:hypothetical protein [Rhodoblastus acidophilus]MCW2276399.1 hypothetical protein [Rhodoblastus acidophilus]MTV33055.1 hypothetical protein [Rhodoblastus acidophilus]